jgi:hypothetical protein
VRFPRVLRENRAWTVCVRIEEPTRRGSGPALDTGCCTGGILRADPFELRPLPSKLDCSGTEDTRRRGASSASRCGLRPPGSFLTASDITAITEAPPHALLNCQ